MACGHFTVAKSLLDVYNLLLIINNVLKFAFSAVEIIKRIDSAHLKLQLDIFHLQHICGDLSYNIKNLMPYVGHIQVFEVSNLYDTTCLKWIWNNKVFNWSQEFYYRFDRKTSCINLLIVELTIYYEKKCKFILINLLHLFFLFADSSST